MKKRVNETWEGGKDFEIDFWEHWILTKGDKWPEEFQSRMDPALVINTSISRFLSSVPGIPRVLDVGAGPLSCIGKVLPDGRKIDLTPIDPLAAKYSGLFKQAGVKPILEPLSGKVEKLDLYFPPDTFDFVFMRNALDHSYNPLLGIRQMVGVVKRGRVVMLEHFTNEAEKAEYGGFHQWNICVENKEFILWNKSNKINVNYELRDIAKIETTGDADWNLMIIEKL